MQRILPLESMRGMYKSLVHSYLRYCIPVWGCCGATTVDKLQRLQNSTARIVANSHYDTPSLSLIKELGWLTNIERIETAKMVFKSLNDSAPIYVTQMFQRLSDASARQLRQTPTNFNAPEMRSTRDQNFFAYR